MYISCQQCRGDSYFDITAVECKTCLATHSDGCLKCTASTCSECDTGFILANGKCKTCAEEFPYCG